MKKMYRKQRPVNRYFIVYFEAKDGCNINVVGMINMTTNYGYLSRTKAINNIEELGLKEVTITNIIELSYQEYKQWCN